MRILHGPEDIAGQAGLSVLGLRELGETADAAFIPNRFGYAQPPDLRISVGTGLKDRIRRMAQIWQVTWRYDLYHFHFGRSFLPDTFGLADARFYRRLGRKVVVEFWGSDIRLPDVEAARNPYYMNSLAEDPYRNRERMKRWAEVTEGHVIISDHYFDPFLAPYFPTIHVVGQRADTRRITPVYPSPEQKVPRVVHAPSHLAFKGTEQVRQAVDTLRRQGLALEYVEVTGKPHSEAVEIYASADLIIDQVRDGSHGVFAVEAMSLGKPVICYILPELLPTYPEGFPIINANPDTLVEVLADWLRRPADRHVLGIQSRRYAEQVHDCRVVANRLLQVYKDLPGGG